jgi:excisionase family DNA binding protein
MTTNLNQDLAVGHQAVGHQADGRQATFVAVEPFITKPEVARRLGKQVRTVDNWMQRGLLPYYKIGRSVSFKWSEVERHLKAVCHVNGALEE